MSRRAWAWTLAGTTAAGVTAQVVLLVAAGVPLLSGEALDRTFPIVPVATLVGAVVGVLIVRRHPDHPIGWLFCVGQAGTAVGLAAQALGAAVLAHGLDAPAGIGQVALWVGSLFGAGYALALLAGLLLLAPDGHLPSRRWRPALWWLGASYGLTVVALLLTPPSRVELDGSGAPGELATLLGLTGDLGIALALPAGAAALAVRLRRARGDERRQLRWVAGAAVVLAAAVVITVGVNLARGDDTTELWQVEVLLYLGYLAVPAATGFAVLRYRLYDIDLIIGSAVRLGVLAAFVTAGYVAAVVGIGTLLGGSAVWPSLLAYVLVALAFQPLRLRVDRLADRVVHGPRAAPYDSLVQFTRRLCAGGSDPELLTLIARECAAMTGASHATVTVTGGAGLTVAWPDGPGPAPQVSIPVCHQGEVLGAIGMTLPAGRSLNRPQRRLLGEFATEAGLAFRNVALAGALRARATALARDGEELAASRRRLVSAADAERARVAAAIRREVVAHLEPLPEALASLTPAVVDDPVGAQRRLQDLEDATTRAIEALRAITGGLLPPLLARRGLAAALESHVRARRTELAVGTGLAELRFATSVEVAAYLCCLEALRGALPGAELAVEVADGRLTVALHGHRPVNDGHEQRLVDRVEALGGQVDATEPSELRLVIPVASAHTAESRSGPKTDLLTEATAPQPSTWSAKVSSS